MAFGRNKAIDVIHDAQPKKIVIVTGPTFGTVAGFILLGAAIGAAGTMYLKNRSSTPDRAGDSTADASLYGGLIGADSNEQAAFTNRTNSLAERVKTLSARARDTIHSASEALAPAIQQAISEAKSVASKTEHDLEEELKEDAESETAKTESSIAAAKDNAPS